MVNTTHMELLEQLLRVPPPERMSLLAKVAGLTLCGMEGEVYNAVYAFEPPRLPKLKVAVAVGITVFVRDGPDMADAVFGAVRDRTRATASHRVVRINPQGA